VLTLRGKLLWVSLFAMAMAYLESAVVVYLRAIYYPQGFDFPLVIAAPAGVMLIEIGREAATIVMLTAIGFFCGRSRMQRFAYLMLAFGIWDILFYLWLKIFINWPASLLTWDILFLIPLPWVGPVLAPVVVSVALIGAGSWIILREEKGKTVSLPGWAWGAEIAAGLVIILSFLLDVRHVVHGGYPNPFHWGIFLLGLWGGLGVFGWQMKVRLKDEG
jgi:hypothetical protein